LKKKKVCACFVLHLLPQDQKHQCAALSVTFVEMIDDDVRNVIKRIVIGISIVNELLADISSGSNTLLNANLVVFEWAFFTYL
jgi:hypothetical protein